MTATSRHDLAEALIRICGRDALRQARENAVSNAKAGDTVSERVWREVAELLERETSRPVSPK
ncbi:MAG TPA: hypothetical protein VGH23_10625 [Rhizomicrobium sp.]